MSLKLADLSVLAYANNFTLWHYKTNQSEDEVFANGYFNNGSDMMNRGDVVYLQTSFGESDMKTQQIVVHSADKGAVTIQRL